MTGTNGTESDPFLPRNPYERPRRQASSNRSWSPNYLVLKLFGPQIIWFINTILLVSTDRERPVLERENATKTMTCGEPVEAADHHGLSAGAAARHGELFLVGTTATAGRRVIVELSGRTSGLVVELHREVAPGRYDVTGSPAQRVRRDRMHDDATLYGNGVIVCLTRHRSSTKR